MWPGPPGHQQDIQFHQNICPGEVAAPGMKLFKVFFTNSIAYLNVVSKENILIPPYHLPEHQDTVQHVCSNNEEEHLWPRSPGRCSGPQHIQLLFALVRCQNISLHVTSTKHAVEKFVQESVFPGLWHCLHLSQWFLEHWIISKKQGC